MSTVQMTLGNNGWKATKHLSIPIVILWCGHCFKYVDMYVGITKDQSVNGKRCMDCGKRSTIWTDYRVDMQYDGCVFTVDDRRVE